MGFIRMLIEKRDTELGSKPPNPRRVAAGKRNRALRRGLTEAGREQLRLASLLSRPWQHSTGPKTAKGKAQAAANGKRRQLGPVSVRQLRADMAHLATLVRAAVEARTSPPRLTAR